MAALRLVWPHSRRYYETEALWAFLTFRAGLGGCIGNFFRKVLRIILLIGAKTILQEWLANKVLRP